MQTLEAHDRAKMISHRRPMTAQKGRGVRDVLTTRDEKPFEGQCLFSVVVGVREGRRSAKGVRPHLKVGQVW